MGIRASFLAPGTWESVGHPDGSSVSWLLLCMTGTRHTCNESQGQASHSAVTCGPQLRLSQSRDNDIRLMTLMWAGAVTYTHTHLRLGWVG